MSAVIADPAGAAAPQRGKKKLIVIGAAVLAVLLLLSAGGVFLLKQRAARAAAELEDESRALESGSAKSDPRHVPFYLPLDPFVVNLADREVDRFAQIGITFELDSGASGEQLKAYMPAVRNAILMVLANKTSRDLLDRAGKEQLAREIMREAVRPMGIEMPVPEAVSTLPAAKAEGATVAAGASAATATVAAAVPATAGASGAAAVAVPGAAVAGGDDLAAPKAKPRLRRDMPRNPIQQVHFSSFIVQ